ncbi:thioredoxin [Dongia mobilis]|uniref:Thioredoxin n=1 Tax=Dongia mobilis TaxID=578943 RepID=A0A4R6WTI4_9PROT|nr:co-chaperone YbbN [Dongia mobilis]TDQ83079.1 thioredoxin [Dongia mobilis]
MDQLIGAAPGAAGGVPADLVKDATQNTFKADVIDASMQVPVIVDFWAPWCGPCKQLGPLLEKVVKEARGAVRMVKINVDENQALAGQMRIQSIPAVYAFFQGRPVDGFQGLQPEGQLKAFVGRLAQLGGGGGPSPIDDALEQADAAHAEGDHATATEIYGQILEHEPENLKAIAGIVRCLIALGEVEQAAEFLGRTPKGKENDAAIAGARAQLEVAQAGAKAAGQADALRARVDANPKDFEARHELAQALFAGGDREGAIDQLLEIVRVNRAWNEEAARKQLVTFFEAMGPTDPLTLSGRRRLSSLLFS